MSLLFHDSERLKSNTNLLCFQVLFSMASAFQGSGLLLTPCSTFTVRMFVFGHYVLLEIEIRSVMR